MTVSKMIDELQKLPPDMAVTCILCGGQAHHIYPLEVITITTEGWESERGSRQVLKVKGDYLRPVLTKRRQSKTRPSKEE